MSCCEQACVTYEYRPHLMVNGVQCGMDELCKLIALDLPEDLIVKIEQVPVCGH